MSRSMRSALRLRSIVGMDEDPTEWPPPEARLRAIRWRVEAHFERGEFFAAACALRDGFGLGDDELLHGLHHLAAAGYRLQTGEPERARRQLAHARRRLAGYPETASLVDAVVESAGGELA
jgi:hypothetical protein